ncbi:MAG: hypothetical protein ACFFDT_36375 [Candidatus Hodarchaeota archaeon]
MSNNNDFIKNRSIDGILLEETVENLSRFKNQESSYIWGGSGQSSISESEKVMSVMNGGLAIYQDDQIRDYTIIWTTERSILFGTEIQTTLIASLVSREFEQKRGLVQKSDSLTPLKTMGWDIYYDQITKLEIIKTGNLYSAFFFNANSRLFVVNDLESEEIQSLKSFMSKFKHIEISEGEFTIPLSDIFLLLILGVVLTFIGWILIAIIF